MVMGLVIGISGWNCEETLFEQLTRDQLRIVHHAAWFALYSNVTLYAVVPIQYGFVDGLPGVNGGFTALVSDLDLNVFCERFCDVVARISRSRTLTLGGNTQRILLLACAVTDKGYDPEGWKLH